MRWTWLGRRRVCTRCGNPVVPERPSVGKGLLALIGVKAYACDECGLQFLGFKRHGAVGLWGLLACIVLAVLIAPVAVHWRIAPEAAAESVPSLKTSSDPAPFPEALGNDDIVSMSQARVADSVIEALIVRSPQKFKIDTGSLVAMRQSGVSDHVLGLMLDRTRIDLESTSRAEHVSPAPPQKGSGANSID